MEDRQAEAHGGVEVERSGAAKAIGGGRSLVMASFQIMQGRGNGQLPKPFIPFPAPGADLLLCLRFGSGGHRDDVVRSLWF